MVHVSNMGRVRTARGVVHGGHVRDGYHRVTVGKRSHTLHVLVARAFLGPPPSAEHTVDHIDMDTSNNAASNLRWATRSEQILGSYRLNLARSKAVDKRALRIEARPRGGASSEWTAYESCSDAARKLGTSQGDVWMCLKGTRKTAVGYEFRVLEEESRDADETWVEVDGVGVSDRGRVRTRRGHVHCGSGGACRTYLTAYVGEGKRRYVHVLVARGFLGPRPTERHTVDHVNNDPRDNRVANLRWATPQEQMRRSFDTNAARRSHASKTSKPVRVRRGDDAWQEYSGVNEAVRRLGCDVATMHKVLKTGRSWRGLRIEYVPFEDLPGEVWRSPWG